MKELSIICLFFLSCSNEEVNQENKPAELQDTAAVDSTENEKLLDDSIAIWYQQSQKEFSEFNKKYQFDWSTKKIKEPTKFPWKQGNKILVYYVAGEGEKQATWECRTSSGKEISQLQYQAYCDVLNNRDSYNNTTASCFIPGLVIVVYDEDQVPMEYSEVCLDCNKIISVPYDIDFNFGETDFYGLSSEARSSLRAMFLEWGMPYGGFSKSWDDNLSE